MIKALKILYTLLSPLLRRIVRLVNIEQATWNDGILAIEGWAIWLGTASPRVIRFFVNNTYVGETRLNCSRPDLWWRVLKHHMFLGCGFRFHSIFLIPSNDILIPYKVQLRLQFVDQQGRTFHHVTKMLCSTSGDDQRGKEFAALARFGDECQKRLARNPTILDWNSSLGLSATLSDAIIFSPLTTVSVQLPYLDQSIDVVAIASNDPEQRIEAGRIATLAIIFPDHTSGSLSIEWLSQSADDRASQPSVSIIIPVYNHYAYTQACLAQLQVALPPEFHGEIIIIDDGSTDETSTLLEQWAAHDDRILVLYNTTNAGFIASTHRGAQTASGDILLFLNNDTLPQVGWLPPLIQALRELPDAGAVGCKLILPNGLLQEAGGIIFSDGTGTHLGRGAPNVDHPLYNYVREVDYCSGAVLATWRALYFQMGGFDTQYSPAYCEDSDYCFNLRAHGYRVYYQPASVVIHTEGATSGTNVKQGVKKYQVINQRKFAKKWREALKHQPPPPRYYGPATIYDLAVRDDYFDPSFVSRSNEDQ